MAEDTEVEEYGEDKIGSSDEPDLTILGVTGTPIGLDTYIDDPVPFPLRAGGLKPAKEVAEGEFLTVIVTLDAVIDQSEDGIEGGIRLIFKDADNFEPSGLRRKFIPIPKGQITNGIRFQVPNVGKGNVIVLARAATRPEGQPNNVTIVNPKRFWVANLRII